jgi:hypothetical protein
MLSWVSADRVRVRARAHKLAEPRGVGVVDYDGPEGSERARSTKGCICLPHPVCPRTEWNAIDSQGRIPNRELAPRVNMALVAVCKRCES